MIRVFLFMQIITVSSQIYASTQASQPMPYSGPYINCNIENRLGSNPFGSRRIIYIPQPGPVPAAPSQSQSCGVKNTSTGPIEDMNLVNSIRKSLVEEFGYSDDSRQREIRESLKLLNARFPQQQAELHLNNASK